MRAILLRHALPQDPAVAEADPTDLLAAAGLRDALAARDAAGQRALAEDYVALWARTFRTLVRHLRGRPDRALALFAEEVYPFLRGERRPAPRERLGPRAARVWLAPDLPAPYLAGLVASFVGLSGTQAAATANADGSVDVTFQASGRTALARASQAAAVLRLPLLAAAALAALVGLAFATPAPPATAAVVLAGTVAAQGAANLLHAWRRGERHPFGPPEPRRSTALAGSLVLYAAAGACAAWLAFAQGRMLVLAFAAIGLALGLAYAAVRAQGLGPAVAALTYGVLLPVGAAYAADPRALQDAWLVALAGAPVGFAAAAHLLLDNVADRPLDEAGGQRTLAVRLPQPRNVVAFAALLAGCAAALAVFALPAFSPLHLLGAVAVIAAGAGLVGSLRRHLDDPHDLAPARVGTFALLVAIGLLQALWLVGA